MAWTTPKTNWATGELVTAQDMNAVGENLAALSTLRSTVAVYTVTADLTVPSSDTFADVDGNNFNLTITTAGGDVLVHFHGVVSSWDFIIDVEVDGNRLGHATHGIRRAGPNNDYVSFTHLIQGLSVGSHTFKLQGRKGTTLYTGAQFWVREI